MGIVGEKQQREQGIAGTASVWYHALFHHRSCTAPWVNRSFGYAGVACGGLAYSHNGVDWHYADPSGTAYRPTVQWAQPASAGASSTHFNRRERPHLIFDERQRMVALTNGVQYRLSEASGMNDATYTLLQPIAS